MSTKSTPGSFRCYEAALPDEPMFVILGRDPAGPATLHFWAQERIKQGKTKEIDDNARIGACLRESEEMANWRKKIMDHAEQMGEPPAWKLPRPVEHGEDRPIRMEPALGMPFVGAMRPKDHDLIVSVGKAIREITNDLQEWWREDDSPRPGEGMNALIARFHAEVERLAEAARNHESGDPYKEFAARLGKPQPREWFAYEDTESEHPIICHPLSFTRMSELLDYATGYGEFDENTPSGTEAKEPNVAGEPMNDMRRTAIWTYKRCMGIIGEEQAFNPPVADDSLSVPTVPVYVEGLFAVPGIDAPQSMEEIAATYRKAAQSVTVGGVKMPTLDSAPDDLAHAPEVPHHRFGVFHEAGDYAYARGLEVSPMHLATALDAMAKSGWHLCAIFGQTDAQHIGFIFRREVERFSAFEIAHGYGGGFMPDATARAEESKAFKRFKAGESMDTIRTDCGGPGQEPCPEMGRGLEP